MQTLEEMFFNEIIIHKGIILQPIIFGALMFNPVIVGSKFVTWFSTVQHKSVDNEARNPQPTPFANWVRKFTAVC